MNQPFEPPSPSTQKPLSVEELRMGAILLEACIHHQVGPLIGRFGGMDQALEWLKTSAWQWNEVFRTGLPIRRWALNFELGRVYSWSYRVQERLDRGEPVDEGGARCAYTAKITLLSFFLQNADKSFTAGDISRKFRQKLDFVQPSDFEQLLLLYVGKQFLVREGNRFRIRERYTPIVVQDFQQRIERLKRRMETLAPLGQAYLEGRAQLISLDAKLPMELWEEFQVQHAEFVKRAMAELVEKSNGPEFEGVKEYTGGAFMMVGPYPWTPPHWLKEWEVRQKKDKPESTDEVPPESAT